MASEKTRARSYFLTGNNPERLIKEMKIDHLKAKEEDYEASLKVLIDIWVKGDEKHPNPRNPALNGIKAVWERGGERKTNHVHMLLCSRNAIEERIVKQRFPGFHIDIVKAANVTEIDAYLEKAGKHEGKGTQLCRPVSWGEYFCTNRESGASKLYQDLEKYVKLGMTPSQIILQDPRFSMHEQMVQAYFGAYRQSKIKPIREIKTIYHTGEVGSGKSYTYVSLCRQHGEEAVFMFNGSSSTHGGFDEYECEEYLVLDEIRPDTFRIQEFLTLLDGYKRRLPARYKNKYAAWTEVHITTVIPPEELFMGMKRYGRSDTFEQLRRRLDSIVYHYIDERYQGAEKYRTTEIAASRYESIDQLKEMAAINKELPMVAGDVQFTIEPGGELECI